MGENNDREYVAKMFKRNDEVVNENIDLAEYLKEYVENLEQKKNNESLKYDKDYDLLECCKDYLDNPTEEKLERFKESLEHCSTMSAPVAYQFVNKYKNNSEYRNQCVVLQQMLLEHINENNINSKAM